MTFNLKGKIEKQIWAGNGSYLYKVVESLEDRTRSWSIFTKQELSVGQSYDFEGEAYPTKNKKTGNWETGFQANIVSAFNYESIPF